MRINSSIVILSKAKDLGYEEKLEILHYFALRSE